jgi:hypothetical protein
MEDPSLRPFHGKSGTAPFPSPGETEAPTESCQNSFRFLQFLAQEVLAKEKLHRNEQMVVRPSARECQTAVNEQ